MHVLDFVTLLFLVHVCLGLVPACYFYGGAQATLDVPCDPDASDSACCGPNFVCATNLYCVAPTGVLIIGSCTDPTWQSADCPLPVDQTSKGVYFSSNEITNCSDGTICPNSSKLLRGRPRRRSDILQQHSSPTKRSERLLCRGRLHYPSDHFRSLFIGFKVSVDDDD